MGFFAVESSVGRVSEKPPKVCRTSLGAQYALEAYRALGPCQHPDEEVFETDLKSIDDVALCASLKVKVTL